MRVSPPVSPPSCMPNYQSGQLCPQVLLRNPGRTCLNCLEWKLSGKCESRQSVNFLNFPKPISLIEFSRTELRKKPNKASVSTWPKGEFIIWLLCLSLSFTTKENSIDRPPVMRNNTKGKLVLLDFLPGQSWHTHLSATFAGQLGLKERFNSSKFKLFLTFFAKAAVSVEHPWKNKYCPRNDIDSSLIYHCVHAILLSRKSRVHTKKPACTVQKGG